MGRKYVLITIGFLSAAAIVSCQSKTGLVDNLPAPNFYGPVISGAPVSASPMRMPPVAVTPRPSEKASILSEKAWAINVPARRWKYIVIHHSASPSGNAAKFDKEHRRENGWDELGYHFVIGNGTDSGNGQVEVGPRWPKQKWGAHAKTPDNRFNDYGIGICLVGNFDIDQPTPQQMQALVKLTSYLRQTYRIPATNIYGHRDTKPTDCPGINFDMERLRSMVRQSLAEAGVLIPSAQTASATETLTDG